MEDEVIIIEVQPQVIKVRPNMYYTPQGKIAYRCRCGYIKELYMYKVNKQITHRPEYLAIRDPGGDTIDLLFEIDQLRSVFEEGYLEPLELEKENINVEIILIEKDKFSTNHGVWYTSFRTLLTHNQQESSLKKNPNLLHV